MKLNEAIQIQEAKFSSPTVMYHGTSFDELVATDYFDMELEKHFPSEERFTQKDIPKLEKLKRKKISNRRIDRFVSKNMKQLRNKPSVQHDIVRKERDLLYFDTINELKTQPFREEVQHAHDQINEIASQGDYKAIGIMELSAFYQKASDAQKKQLQALIQKKDVNAVWNLVYQVTGLRI